MRLVTPSSPDGCLDTGKIGLFMNDITTAIRDALAQHGRLSVGIDEVTDDADLYALGLASHATVNVVMALEDELDIEIPDELLVKSTFASIDAIRTAIGSVSS